VSSVNKVILIGRLGKDPEVKFTASGNPVCTFSLATNEKWKDNAGNDSQRTEWHSIVVFGKLATICGDYLMKGKLCYIEGSIRSNKYEDRTGNERKSYDIVARYMRMLSPSANGNGTKPKESQPGQPPEHSDEDNPFNQDEASIPF